MKNLICSLPIKLRFILIGGINTIISYLLFLVFLGFLKQEHYQLSLALAWVCSSFISFTTQKIFVFQSSEKWFYEYLRCVFSWLLAYIINALILEITVSVCQLSPLYAQMFAVCCTTILTFFLFKNFAFRKG